MIELSFKNWHNKQDILYPLHTSTSPFRRKSAHKRKILIPHHLIAPETSKYMAGQTDTGALTKLQGNDRTWKIIIFPIFPHIFRFRFNYFDKNTT
jgi:hypothetical protein